MKRVLIPIAVGMSLRNILRTDLHAEMVSRGLRPVYLVPEPIAPRLSAELSDGSAEVGVLPSHTPHRAERLLADLAFASVENRHHLETLDLVRRRAQRDDPRRPLKERLYPLVGRSRTVYRALDALRRGIFKARHMDAALDRHRPDLVFSNNLFHPGEAAMLRRAMIRGIPAVGMVLSWDNPSNKGILPARADRTLVWSEVMAREMSDYFGLTAGELEVVGSPQFDQYARPPTTSREALFAHYGFAPDRALVVYATGALGHYPDEHRYPAALADAFRDGRISGAGLLVRLHPQDRIEKYEHLVGRPGVVVSGAGGATKAWADRWFPSREDHEHYAALLKHSDVILNMASSVALDAAANDTPVVSVAWEVAASQDYLDSAQRIFDFTHTKRLLSAGGTYVVRSEREMIDAVNRALADPDELAAGRARIARQEGFDGKGRSAAKIAAVLADVTRSG